MAPKYARIDFNQSSNHLYITKTDLHLYDDGSQSDFPLDWNIDNGAIQLILSRVSVDIYVSLQNTFQDFFFTFSFVIKNSIKSTS